MPVAAVGLLPELGGASRTVPPGDPAALAALLVTVLEDRRARAAMASAAIELAHGRYSLAAAVAGHRRLYEELAAPGA